MNLNQAMVPVSDLDRSVDFYKKLGLTLITYADHGYARFECPGGATFSIHTVEEPIRDHFTTIYFEVEKLDDHVALLKSRGLSFVEDPVDQPYLWREAHLRDPDGNKLCLFWAGENRRFPPWRIEERL